jgi:hypothetical protein
MRVAQTFRCWAVRNRATCWHHHLAHDGHWTVTAHGNGHFTWHPPHTQRGPPPQPPTGPLRL